MNRDSAEADLAIPIRGSENSGTIHVHARKRGDRWAFEVAVVEIRGRDEPIDLLEGLDMLRVERSGERPPWSRTNEGWRVEPVFVTVSDGDP